MQDLSHQKNKIKEKSKNYADVLKSSNHSEDNHKKGNHDQKNTVFSLNKYKNEFIRTDPLRRPFITRYQNIFLGYCFSCKNFNHKEIYCKAYGINSYMINMSKISYKNYKAIKTRGCHWRIDRNYDPFSPLH
jgi:hypothetical protein